MDHSADIYSKINFRYLVEGLTDYFFILDKKLKIVYCNHKVEELFQSTLKNISGKSIIDLYPGLGGTKAEQIYREAVKKGIQKSFIHDFKLNDVHRILLISVNPTPQGVIILGKDITESNFSGESVKYYEMLYRTTLDSLMEGCAIFSPEWKYLYVNDANARHAQHNKEELLGKRIQDLFPGIEETSIFKTYKRVMMSRIPEQIISPYTFPNGSVTWFELKVVPVPEGIFILSSDITERRRHEEEILKYQSILNQTEKMAHLGSWWIDNYNPDSPEKNILRWSDEVYNIFGQSPEIELTQEFFFNCVHPDDRIKLKNEVKKTIEERRELNIEHKIVRPDGSVRRVIEHGVISFDKNGKPCRFLGAVKDITELREAVEEREQLVKEIAKERDKLKTILETVPQEIWILDAQTHKLKINEAIKLRLGLNISEDLDLDEVLSLLKIKNPNGGIRNREETPVLRSLKGEIVTGDEIIVHPVTGEMRYRQFHSAPVRNNSGEITTVVAIVNDITEQKKTEEFIKASLKEKEILLKELYHRTKNNMQVISSLLGLKAAASGDSRMTGIVNEMNNRIQAISLVHQKLYQSNNLSKIDLAEYISDLVNLLISSYSITPDKLTVEKVLQPVQVLLDTAVPCGLIVNELVSNSLKYAFPGRKRGCLTIKLAKHLDQIDMTIADNGVGLKETDTLDGSRLGLKLFHMIAEDQLQAITTLDTENGTSWNIRFNDALYKERI